MEKPDTIKRHNPLIVAPKKTFAKLTARDRLGYNAFCNIGCGYSPLGYNAQCLPAAMTLAVGRPTAARVGAGASENCVQSLSEADDALLSSLAYVRAPGGADCR
jgi:hypothetical protein